MNIMSARTTTAALLALLLAGCSPIPGQAVEAQDMTAAGNDCTEVEAPMTMIPAEANDEPRLRIPQPDGWETTTMAEANTGRFEMENKHLAGGDFAWVLVMLESQPGKDDPEMVLDAFREGMLSEAGATNVDVTDGTVCGHRAQTMRYEITPREQLSVTTPAASLVVVAHGTDRTYAAIVSILTTNSDVPEYKDAAETIFTGFQVLPSVT
jgi:hypothetical protein